MLTLSSPVALCCVIVLLTSIKDHVNPDWLFLVKFLSELIIELFR